MRVGSLFSGIGGFDLGLERAGGYTIAWQCECDSYCRTVLAQHWPGVPCYPDVRALGCDVPRVDVLCGGFTCQPVSVAGKRLGTDDPRWLWPAFARAIALFRPAVVPVENVPGLRTAGLRDVLGDLAALGFDAEWTRLGAFHAGAPHHRLRLWLVATDPERVELWEQPGWLSRAAGRAAALAGEPRAAWDAADAESSEWGPQPDSRGSADAAQPTLGAEGTGESRISRPTRDAPDADAARELQPRGGLGEVWRRTPDGGWWPPVAPVRRVDDGLPAGLASRQIAALGNAIVPQLAEWLGRVVMEHVRLKS